VAVTAWLLLQACGGGVAPGSGADAGSDGGLLRDGRVGSACSPHSDDCGPLGTCAEELTGGTAFEFLAAPLPAPHGYCTAECSHDADCGVGGVCFGVGLLGSGGECRRACAKNSDCGADLECARAQGGQTRLLPNSCQPLPPTDQLADDQAGAPCSKDAQCGEGYCEEASDPRGGYCTGACAQDGDCGHGGVCVHGIYGSGGTCYESCTQDSDCQLDDSGWGCGTSGLCVRKADPFTAAGAACTSATALADCGSSGTCRSVGLSGEHYPGGYCVGACDDDGACGPHGVCINGLTCMRACSSAADCREGYDCRPHPQALGDDRNVTICYPQQ
jgi:hypothetical protein